MASEGHPQTPGKEASPSAHLMLGRGRLGHPRALGGGSGVPKHSAGRAGQTPPTTRDHLRYSMAVEAKADCSIPLPSGNRSTESGFVQRFVHSIDKNIYSVLFCSKLSGGIRDETGFTQRAATDAGDSG